MLLNALAEESSAMAAMVRIIGAIIVDGCRMKGYD